MVQAAHAAHESGIHFGNAERISSLVVCVVRSEKKLLKALNEVTSKGIKCIPFEEPDLGSQITSFASEPISGSKREAFSKYLLWDSQ